MDESGGERKFYSQDYRLTPERIVSSFQVTPQTSPELRVAVTNPELEVVNSVVRGGFYIVLSQEEARKKGHISEYWLSLPTGGGHATVGTEYFIYPGGRARIEHIAFFGKQDKPVPFEPKPPYALEVKVEFEETENGEIQPVLNCVEVRPKDYLYGQTEKRISPSTPEVETEVV